MNKKLIYTILGAIAIVCIVVVANMLAPDTNTPTQKKTDLKVAATIFPIYDIAKQVAGDIAHVELILPAGASPHTFDPTPASLAKLQNTKRIFAVGLGLDAWTAGIAENTPGAKVVELDAHIKVRASKKHDKHEDGHDDHENEHHDGDEHGEFDPHYWLNPGNAVLLAEAIAEDLSLLDQAHRDEYHKNADAFVAELKKHDAIWNAEFSGLKTRSLVTFHDAFSYFAYRFDLTVAATFEPFPGKEPTPSYLQELEHEIEELGVDVVFTEPQLHGASLRQFAKDHRLSIAVLDPLGGVEDRTSYIELIDYNVQTIAKALK